MIIIRNKIQRAISWIFNEEQRKKPSLSIEKKSNAQHAQVTAQLALIVLCGDRSKTVKAAEATFSPQRADEKLWLPYRK